MPRTSIASAAPCYDPRIIMRKAALMQRIADYVRGGYHWYVTGEVPVERAAAFARKARDLYLVGIGDDARYRRKKSGLANSVLLWWAGPDPTSRRLWWILLVTDHDHPAHRLEPLRDARSDRLELTGYELVRVSRPGQARPALTWRMTKQTANAWRTRIRAAVRSSDPLRLRQAWHSLHLAPGFSPVRAEVKRFVHLIRAEWRRVRSEPFPFGRRLVPYLQRLRDDGIPLSIHLRGLKRLAPESRDHTG